VIMEAEAPAVRVGATPSGLMTPSHLQPRMFFTGRMPFLPPNQQHQSTAGVKKVSVRVVSVSLWRKPTPTHKAVRH